MIHLDGSMNQSLQKIDNCLHSATIIPWHVVLKILQVTGSFHPIFMYRFLQCLSKNLMDSANAKVNYCTTSCLRGFFSLEDFGQPYIYLINDEFVYIHNGVYQSVVNFKVNIAALADKCIGFACKVVFILVCECSKKV